MMENGYSSEEQNGNSRMKSEDESDDDLPISSRSRQTANGSNGKASKPVKKIADISDEDEEDHEEEEDDESEEDDYDDVPISKTKKTSAKPASKSKAPAKKAPPKPAPKKKRPASSEDDEDEEKNASDAEDSDDQPIRRKVQGKSKGRVQSEGDSDSDDDVPLGKRKKAASGKTAVKKKAVKKSDAKSSKAVVSKKGKPAANDKKRKAGDIVKTDDDGGKVRKKSRLEQEEELIYKWWTPEEQELRKLKEEKGIKWVTLEHHGVLFPPEYEPHGVKLLYDGKPVTLTPDEEEVATMFAAMLETDYAKKPIFRDNFMKDWLKVLNKGRKEKKHVIQKLDKCDFTHIFEHLQREKEKKKNMAKEEKKAIKETKAAAEAKFMVAMVDNHKEKVGNFRVEPPGLFRGRGEHPKMGCLKARIWPEDVTINIGEGAPVPKCPIDGHRWKEVIHDNTVTWLAHWKDTINNQDKYVWLAATSSFKGMSDFDKYEKARKLKKFIGKIRSDYKRDWESKDMAAKQRGVALYLIDQLALRVGNEKDEDEADTVGCCSLRVEHISFNDATNEITLDFLGKDSIQYHNTVEVDPIVFRNLKSFTKGKSESSDLFDRLNTASLNAYLKTLMDGLTAKVFRTYNASVTLDRLLHESVVDSMDKNKKLPDKLVDYNRANREVAILCNHQRAAPKNHAQQMEKINEKVKDLEDEWKKFERWQKQAKKSGGSIEVDDIVKPKKKKNADGEEEDDGEPKIRTLKLTVDKIKAKIDATRKKLDQVLGDMQIKDANKTVALGTSKINYMDPRISVAWCKRHDVPISKVFNATLQAKFMWALDVDPDFHF